MNIFITKEEHEILQLRTTDTLIIGSHLYKTNNENSDIDYLCIYKPFETDIYSGLPNIHQFQYKDEGIDYIYTSEIQFWKNFYSGDSTINVDVILFNEKQPIKRRIERCRSYKIIKAYIGFAKRDLKYAKEGNHKLIHAKRSLYCAECLINNILPDLERIKSFYYENLRLVDLVAEEKELRTICNNLYQENKLLNYSLPYTNNRLVEKLLQANNTKEFKYE